jgi:hypothetical protein
VTKLLLILFFSGVLANTIASANSEPPLLIDSQSAAASLDAND